MSPLILAFSFFEYAWGAVSAWAIYKLWPAPFELIWLPALYIAYLAIMIGWGVYEYKDLTPESDMPVLTPKMVYAGIAFGGVFFLCCIYVLVFT